MNSITIPDSLPGILKSYVKAAIRCQPEDIISWSADYFKATDDQYIPVVNKDEHISVYKQDRTLFRILAFQLGSTIGTKERIEEVWSDLSLDFNLLNQIYKIGNFHAEHVDMTEFLGITFGHWTKSLKETVLLSCEAFCKCLATDGYFLHVDVACKLYKFLAKLDCSRPDSVNNSKGKYNEQNGGVELDDDNESKPAAAVKTSRSLDVPLSENLLKNGCSCSVLSTSLESVFARPGAMADEIGYEIGPTDDPQDRGTTAGYHHHVPGIGPSVSDARVREVIEYFRKCAAENGGYVYEFDIESDQCPQLDATDRADNLTIRL